MKKRFVKLAAVIMSVISLLPMGVFADEQTAPMPEQISTVEDIVGTWIDNPEAKQPHIYEFWEEDGKLMYTHYQICPGNGSGVATKKTYTEFEYRSGEAILMGHWGSINCLTGNDGMVYSSFYHDSKEQTLIDAVDGKTTYHKVENFKYTLK